MKKIILLSIIFMFNTSISYSQNTNYSLLGGVGVSYFNEETQEASQVGANFSFAIFDIYVSVASNFAQGTGEELDFSSSETYSANKTQVLIVNVGYVINIKRFAVVPVIGYGSSKKIYNDPISFNTYFYGDSETKFNFGAKGMYFISDNVGITLGVGSYEIFSGGINFRL